MMVRPTPLVYTIHSLCIACMSTEDDRWKFPDESEAAAKDCVITKETVKESVGIEEELASTLGTHLNID